jgi:hypothetical protein
LTFQVGKNSPDYKKVFGVVSGALAMFGTIGFAALIIEGFYTKITASYFQLVWLTVGCMLIGLVCVSVYQVTKGGRS